MTAKGKTLYLHVFDMPKGQIELDGLAAKVVAVKALDGRAPVKFNQTGGKVVIEAAGLKVDPHATVLELTTR
jgi:hypothetical protein